jgi:ribosome-associated protein
MALKKKTSSPKAKKSGTKTAAPRKKSAAKKPSARKKSAFPKSAKKRNLLKGATAATASPAENPHAKALAYKVANLLLEKKATDVMVLDVRGMASYADYIVLASGESDRQVSAMAENVHVKVKHEDGLHPLGSEGRETGQWVLLDYGEVVAHLFLAERREFYDLEGLWADAPREKLA